MDNSQTNQVLDTRTPLAESEPVEGTNTLLEKPLTGKINLRGELDNPAFLAAIESALQTILPNKANTVVPFLGGLVFWLGPNEWLVHTPLNELEARIESLHQALADTHAAITDVSDYYTILELSGPQAREVIASGSPFDTREAHFKPGQCAQTHFSHASILLWPINDKPTFGIQVRWSYAQYLFDYLAESIGYAEGLAAGLAAGLPEK